MRTQFAHVTGGEQFRELSGKLGDAKVDELCYKLREPEKVDGQPCNARRCADGEPKIFLPTDEVEWIRTITI